MKQREEAWKRARKLCRLSVEEVRMARTLGLNPVKLVDKIPSKSQPWKAPVNVWVRELYEKRSPGRRTEQAAPARRPERKQRVTVAPPMEPWEFELEAQEPWDQPRSLEEQIEEADRDMLRLQRDFRAAAEFVAFEMAQLEAVSRVVLFGSVAGPLWKEVPRFHPLRRARAEVFHECSDVDLAVWVAEQGSLKGLQRARSSAVQHLLEAANIAVAHHQVDVFLMEPGSDRYLGRLCLFGQCRKGKPPCQVTGCGALPFLQQHERFRLDPACLFPKKSIVLFDREKQVAPPDLRPWLSWGEPGHGAEEEAWMDEVDFTVPDLADHDDDIPF